MGQQVRPQRSQRSLRSCQARVASSQSGQAAGRRYSCRPLGPKRDPRQVGLRPRALHPDCGYGVIDKRQQNRRYRGQQEGPGPAAVGLDAALDGQLTVRDQPGRVTTASGEVRVEGTYKAYGQDLTIREGPVLYAGTPIDNPSLRVEAVREIDDVVAGLRTSCSRRRSPSSTVPISKVKPCVHRCGSEAPPNRNPAGRRASWLRAGRHIVRAAIDVSPGAW